MQTEPQLDFGDILPFGMTIVVTVIGLAFGAQVTSETRDDTATLGPNCGQNSTGGSTGVKYDWCGDDYNITTQGLSALNKISLKLGTVVTVVLAGIIIGILVRYLWVRFANNGQ